MARRKKTREPAQATADATPADAPVTEPAAETASGIAAGELREPMRRVAASEPTYATDPYAKMSVSLGGHPGGPAMHLLRSRKFHQMQIRFDGGRPDEKYLVLLGEAGWRDRTESEGVWTKQIDRDARWQSVAQMEREFRTVANAIRTDKGLEPALDGLAVA